MNKTFSTRIVELRNEKGISQKEAAAELGISQALLSHYEKGIRECGLDFLCRAASYYDVSCDYLLGMAETKHLFQEEFEDINLAFDAEFRTSTLFRAATMLHDNVSGLSAGRGDKIKLFFSLAIYRIAISAAKTGCIPKSWIGLPLDSALVLSMAKMEEITNEFSDEIAQKHTKNAEEPLCVKTVIGSTEKQLKKEAEKIISSFDI